MRPIRPDLATKPAVSTTVLITPEILIPLLQPWSAASAMSRPRAIWKATLTATKPTVAVSISKK